MESIINPNEVIGLTYLATPFFHENTIIMERRFGVINQVAAELIKQREYVFSPISHSYPIAKLGGLPTDWDYWQHFCILTLKFCTKLTVVMQDGWRQSKGVTEELKIAQTMNMPITYYQLPEALFAWSHT
jgi:hypothetical protein